MITHLQQISLAAAVTAAMSAYSHYIPNTSYLSLGLKAPLRIIHTVFSSQQVKIERNIFTLRSNS